MHPTILEAAHSIYAFISRTAESTETGYRWRTIDYDDQPQYHWNLFNGVGGIPFFLRDYHKLTGERRPLELARGAIRWCRDYEAPTENFQRGVQLGKTGVAYAALYLSEAEEGQEVPTYCIQNARHLLNEPVGPVTDLLSGESSNGWFLLRLWKRTNDANYLKGAIRCGEWIAEQLVRDRLGTHCLARPDGGLGPRPYTGLAHGIAGIAHFMTLLYEATEDPKWREIAKELLATLINHACPAKGGLNWYPVLGGKQMSRCQHSHGAAGIGLVLVHAARILDDVTYATIAEQAGEATYGYGDFRSNSTLCTGLAGSGELFIELFKLTGDALWWDRAREFALLAIEYKTTTDDGDCWPTDSKHLYSADFSYGASGTGHFFLRTLKPWDFAMPLM